MPELPEVEVVRRGLDAHVAGKTITAVRVHHPRAVRRHEAGPADLTARLLDTRITGTGRRGKYLWLTLDDGSALVVHLGMSGQMLLGPRTRGAGDEPRTRGAGDESVPNEGHLRIAAVLDDGTALSFVDQRTFGGWMLADLLTVDGTDVPEPVAHIARDPLDAEFDRDGVVTVLRRKHSEIKRQLLDQTVISGIGNIYADEALWRAKINGNRLASSLTRKQLGELLDAATDVMTEALGQGGTSFDSMYVNVNGESGYFERSLDAYGREVHEPLVVLLPEMSTPPAGAPHLAPAKLNSGTAALVLSVLEFRFAQSCRNRA
jgi:formamidopyrimidine-DNA glycosylase